MFDGEFLSIRSFSSSRWESSQIYYIFFLFKYSTFTIWVLLICQNIGCSVYFQACWGKYVHSWWISAAISVCDSVKEHQLQLRVMSRGKQMLCTGAISGSKLKMQVSSSNLGTKESNCITFDQVRRTMWAWPSERRVWPLSVRGCGWSFLIFGEQGNEISVFWLNEPVHEETSVHQTVSAPVGGF